MGDRRERSLISMARAEGFCIGFTTFRIRILLVLNDLSIEDAETERKIFEFYRLYVPTLTWELYQSSIQAPRNVLPIIQEIVPNLTQELYQELVKFRDMKQIEDFVSGHLNIFKGSPLWERAEDQFDEDEEIENREHHIAEAMDYLADADEDQETYADNREKSNTEGFIPVLLWRSGNCGEEKVWHRENVDIRIQLAKEYLELPSLTMEEIRKTLEETEPEKETAVRSGNAVIIGSQNDGYNHFYIERANPKRPWIIKRYLRGRWEFVGYVETDEYGYVTDECFQGILLY